MPTLLEIGDSSYSVHTDVHFTKLGESKLLASVEIEEESFEEYGDTKEEALNKLASRARLKMK